jgi:Ca2+-binding RTX toxin-like protein
MAILSSQTQSNSTANSLYNTRILYGGDGADTFVATSGDTIVFAGEGVNAVTTGGGDDLIFGGEGKDTIRSGGGNDRIFVNGGTNFVDAGTGTNTVYSDGGDDTFVLNAGGFTEIVTYGANDRIQTQGLDVTSRLVGGHTILSANGSDLMKLTWFTGEVNLAA